MPSHSIKCPLCGQLTNDKEEIKFIKENGRCFTCDHYSIYDDLSQDEIDNLDLE